MYMTDQLVAAMNAYWSVALFTNGPTSDQCEVLFLNLILKLNTSQKGHKASESKDT